MSGMNNNRKPKPSDICRIVGSQQIDPRNTELCIVLGATEYRDLGVTGLGILFEVMSNYRGEIIEIYERNLQILNQ